MQKNEFHHNAYYHLACSVWQKAIRIGAIFLCLQFFFKGSVFADNILSITYPQNDLSLNYINFIFGPLSAMGPNLKTNTFSFIVVKLLALSIAVASVMATYVVFTGTMRSSNEGVFLGQQWSSMGVVVKGVVGLGLLTPDFNGYALIQKLFMTAILSGVGLANTLWSTIITDYAQGNTLLSQSQYTANDQQVAQQLMQIAIMLNVLEQSGLISDYNLNASGGDLQLSTLSSSSFSSSSSLNILKLQGTTYTTIDTNMLTELKQLLAYYYTDPTIGLIAYNILNPANQQNGFNSPSGSLALFISGDDKTLSYWASQSYQMAHTALSIVNKNAESNMDGFLKQGWLSAGSIYWKLSVNGNSTSTYSDSLTIPNDYSTDLVPFLDLINMKGAALSAALLNTKGKMSSAMPNKAGKIRQDSQYEGAVGGIDFSFDALDQVYDKLKDGKDPLIEFIRECQGKLQTIIIFFMTSIITMAVVSFFALLRYKYPMVHLAFYLISSLLIMIVSFALMLVPSVVFGGYYLPLVPMIIYSVSGFSWLFKVIEAIVAAPIVAVALIQATDDDFGKAEAATTMLLSVVLKPALMVIAFAISIRISAIGIIVYSYAMSAFLSYSQFTFTSSSFLLDKLLAYLMLNQFTIYMVVAIVSRSFSIIYQLPDQVFSWIGERGDQADVRSILHETKNGAEQGIKMMSQLFNIGIGISKVANKAFKEFSEKGSGG